MSQVRLAVADDRSTCNPTALELIAARPYLSYHAHDGLVFEDVPLAAVAHELGTPAWVYGAGTMRARTRRLASALGNLEARLHYAVKANDHLAVVRAFAAEGAGADVVSEGEMLRALAAGVAAADIVFSGVGKTEAEMRAALAAGIGQFNVESEQELETLSRVACVMDRAARVALRVNPDVDAGTHQKITTGRADSKFGIALADAAAVYARAVRMPGLQVVGLAVHIGSQIHALAPYRAAYARVRQLVLSLRASGYAVSCLDCGGGLGIADGDEPELSPEAFAGVLRTSLGDLGASLIIEPGRWLVGPAGLLLSSVVLTKTIGNRRFTVLDAAMNDLIRPAMYEAWHGIVPLAATDAVRSGEPTDIVGPVCESSDTFARQRVLPPVQPGARVAILDAGAYGAVMSSTYNARPQAAIAMINGARWTCIRPRQTLAQLWRDESVPDFLS